MSWAKPIESTCPRCESKAVSDTGYTYELKDVGGIDIDFIVFLCRQCGLKFDVREDMLR